MFLFPSFLNFSILSGLIKEKGTYVNDVRDGIFKSFNDDGKIVKESHYKKNKFINKMKAAGCKIFFLHARRAILKGLTPKQNLTIPKLNYEMVYQIKKENPNLEIIINGGISKIEEIKKHLNICDGVMIGRKVYQNPYFLVDIEREVFGQTILPTREEVAEKLIKYLEKEVKLGTKVNHIMRHTVGLYHGQIGSNKWKRYLSDNMMARDSDFQKAKHIMTIVQNNEKINQTIA